MPKRILIIEDDPDIQEVLSFTFFHAGYEVVTASNAHTGLQLTREMRLDLVLLDLNLPDMHGSTVTKLLRSEHVNVPIVVLTALDSVDLKVQLLHAGANDYITKPFNPDELLARVRVQFRQKATATLRVGLLELNFDTREARWDQHPLELKNKEFDLLAFFARAPGRVFHTNELFEALWPPGTTTSPNLLSVHITCLRRKLEEAGALRIIRTVRGLGYGLDLDEPIWKAPLQA